MARGAPDEDWKANWTDNARFFRFFNGNNNFLSLPIRHNNKEIISTMNETGGTNTFPLNHRKAIIGIKYRQINSRNC